MATTTHTPYVPQVGHVVLLFDDCPTHGWKGSEGVVVAVIAGGALIQLITGVMGEPLVGGQVLTHRSVSEFVRIG